MAHGAASRALRRAAGRALEPRGLEPTLGAWRSRPMRFAWAAADRGPAGRPPPPRAAALVNLYGLPRKSITMTQRTLLFAGWLVG